MDIITLYLLLGVASGVLHPAQGCKILVIRERIAVCKLVFPLLTLRDLGLGLDLGLVGFVNRDILYTH